MLEILVSSSRAESLACMCSFSSLYFKLDILKSSSSVLRIRIVERSSYSSRWYFRRLS